MDYNILNNFFFLVIIFVDPNFYDRWMDGLWYYD